MMALDVFDAERSKHILTIVVEKFKAFRMCSSPEASALLVTLIGNVSAATIGQSWATLACKDQILRHFTNEIQIADVLFGTESGEVIEMVSLRDLII
jgi:hypothetical protein